MARFSRRGRVGSGRRPPAPGGLRRVDQAGRVHDFEVAPGDDVELVEHVVVETLSLMPLMYQGDPLSARIIP